MAIRSKTTACFAIACILSLSACAKNILRETFEGDGLGGVLDWSISRSEGGTTVTPLAEKGPDGFRVLRISGGETESLFRHTSLKLVAGGRYRFGAWIRTKGLNPEDRAEMTIYNYGWARSFSVKLPCDTGGEWRRIVREGEMVPSAKNDYGCGFYFSRIPQGAYVDVCHPSLEPLDEETAQGSSPQSATRRYRARIVPIDPLLSEVDADDAKMAFYYPGDLTGERGRFRLEAESCGLAASAAFSEESRAIVSFGKIPEGRHDMSVRIVDMTSGATVASNAYSIVAGKRTVYPTIGRRLNNFVTEVFSAPLKNGTYRFVNPRKGWVFVGFDKPYKGVDADIDGSIRGAVRYREGEPSETMRYLSAGPHEIRVSGVGVAEPSASPGKLTVRLVKTIAHGGGRYKFATSDIPSYRYGRDFYRRHLYLFFNTPIFGGWLPGQNPEMDAELEVRGKRVLSETGIQSGDPVRNDLPKLVERLMGCSPYRAGLDFTVDENGIGASTLMKYNYSEAAWAAFNPNCQIGMFFNDAVRCTFANPHVNASELSAILNSGDGGAMLYPEVYLRVMENESDAIGQIGHWRDFAASARAIMPVAPSRIVYYLGGWLMMGQWSPYYCPEGDIKALYADFLHLLATDPVFADAGGVGFSAPSCDEGILRFAAYAIHYYCIEGGTERLSEKCDLKYIPGHMSNGDFTEGFSGWNVVAAEEGSLSVGHKKGFGRNGEMRKYGIHKAPAHQYGDDFAVFMRSAKSPNTLSRTLTGLVPGRLYELTFCTADYKDVMNPGVHTPDRWTFRATVDNAEVCPDLSFDHQSRMLASDKARGAKIPGIVTHRVVFRAKSAEAVLAFSDWKDDMTPGGDIGERRILNFVGVRPYFTSMGN